MQLVEIQIERFRGLGRMAMAADPVTVLIGENDCGKTSILDAIGIALSEDLLTAPPVGPLDFHRPRGRSGAALDPIGVRLRFAERAVGDWTPAHLERLGPVACPLRDGRSSVTLDVRIAHQDAPPEGDGEPPRSTAAGSRASGSARSRAAATVAFLDPSGAAIEVDARAAHADLRRLVPFFRFSSDRPDWTDILLERAAPLTEGAGADLARGLEALEETLVDPSRDLAAIESAMRALGAVMKVTRDDLAVARRSPDRLTELFLDRLSEVDDALPLSRRGSGARGLMRLLLAAALLAVRGSAVLDPLAHPILAIEDPEAHLHPMALAFLARGLKGVRAQKLVVTHSGELLAAVETTSIRRLVRHDSEVRAKRLAPGTLAPDELRRVSYHVKARRGIAFFARCWLLIEGETEFWLLPAVAQELGRDLWLEGVACVEFAQCGIEPLVKLARDLGIEWHLLAEGDAAGRTYASAAERLAERDPIERRITPLGARDIEHCLWQHGYADVFRRVGGKKLRRSSHGENPSTVIAAAIKASSKPQLAVTIGEAMREAGAPGVPRPLRQAIEQVVALARGTLGGDAAPRRRSWPR
ncbi:MAG TPA: DUF2813 domain-containing protein [Phycisphaerales bacterium]|nr:DUF2813 domain-containing protein [Phycisphaerales bacterium]HMP36397.1 DUF2813 domain-containing protein [Phycisphaerales bacterium]